MKRFSRIMLGIILTSLLAGSIQYVAADDSQNKKSYEDFQTKRMALLESDGYKIHLQVVVRDSQGQLVNVVETIHAWKLSVWLPDGKRVPWLTDAIFDYVLSEKEIFTCRRTQIIYKTYYTMPSFKKYLFYIAEKF